jgi:hypothetical protein
VILWFCRFRPFHFFHPKENLTLARATQHMIRKVTDPNDYLELIEALNVEWKFENEHSGHIVPISKSGLGQLANSQLLTWEYHVWAPQNNKGILICHGGFNPLFGAKMFQEILWLSKDKKSGYKMLKKALEFARKSHYNLLVMGRVEKTVAAKKLLKLYRKLGLKKDSEIWMKKL